MKFIRLGRTGMKVSRLCLGTMNWGLRTEEKEAFAIMDAALEAGINFFDTANQYGVDGHRGWSEEIIGRWFAQGGGRREKTVLATKVFSVMEDENDGPNEGHSLSTYKVRRHCEGSLRRLQTDHIELYQMHHVYRDWTCDEMWDAFESLFLMGKIDYVGSSNFAGWHITKAQAFAEKRNFLGLVSEQHLYNLVCRTAELEVIPAVQDSGLGFLPWSPLGGGLLAGVLENPGNGRRADLTEGIEKNRGKIEAWESLCRDFGESPSSVALAWLLHNPVITAPIIWA
jgi:aryl-alcohol dehydrogenase-like predicted oxidoreductase